MYQSSPLDLLLLGFDHQHPEVYEHCKRLLLHLLVVQGTNSNVQSLASVLLRNREYNDPKVLTVKQMTPEFNLTGETCLVFVSPRKTGLCVKLTPHRV